MTADSGATAGVDAALPPEIGADGASDAARANPSDAPRAAIVVNPIKVDASKLRALVATAEKKSGWAETLWFETTAEDSGAEVTRQAIAAGADVVVAAGGDGTVRAVAEALRDTRVPIGLLPVGTGNLLARNLGLNLTNVEQAVGTVFTGSDRAIDVGVSRFTREDGSTGENVFLVMAGLGLDAKMIAKTNKKLKKAVGWLAYVDGIGRALPELRPVKLRFRVDGGAWKSTSAHTVIVGNCGLLPGGFLLIPDAKPDDGRLDIVALRPEGWFGWLKVWNKIAFENGVLRKSAAGRRIIDLNNDVRSVRYSTAREFELTLDGTEDIQLDGDAWGRATAVHTWVDPGALLVRVPVGAARALSPAVATPAAETPGEATPVALDS